MFYVIIDLLGGYRNRKELRPLLLVKCHVINVLSSSSVSHHRTQWNRNQNCVNKGAMQHSNAIRFRYFRRANHKSQLVWLLYLHFAHSYILCVLGTPFNSTLEHDHPPPPENGVGMTANVTASILNETKNPTLHQTNTTRRNETLLIRMHGNQLRDSCRLFPVRPVTLRFNTVKSVARHVHLYTIYIFAITFNSIDMIGSKSSQALKDPSLLNSFALSHFCVRLFHMSTCFWVHRSLLS